MVRGLICTVAAPTRSFAMDTWKPATPLSRDIQIQETQWVGHSSTCPPKLTPNAGTTTTSRTRKPGPSHDTNSVQEVHRRVRERSAGLGPGVYGWGTEVDLGPK